jgi:hypothetical protein
MNTLILSLVFLSSLYAQTKAAGKVSITGATQMSASQLAPFNVLTLTTQNSFAPSASLLPGFPTVTGGNPAEGYQGGVYINNMAIFTPWQYGVAIPHGTVLAYTGGPSGTFHCTSPVSCAANWVWFNMASTANLPLNCPSGYTPCPAGDAAVGYTCGAVVDNNSNVYFIPGVDNQTPVMMRYNALASGGLTSPASYTYFSAPAKGSSPLGGGYGWCTGVFDGRYVYYVPTSASAQMQNTVLLRYDTQGAGGFVISNFTNFDLSTGPGGSHSCCFESSAYDGGQNVYLIPDSSFLTVYNTLASGGFTSAGSYKVLNMANLGTAGYPRVTGTGNLNAVQTMAAYIGGQMVWDPAGATEYLYMAPFGPNPGSTHASTILLSTVARVPVATCRPGVPGTQSCTGTFTALDITASTSTWEIFDLANLTTNQSWSTAGFAYPPLFTPPSALTNQLSIGGFQLTWLNVHSTADPIVGFVADYGNFFVRHHASHTLSDPSGWDVAERPAGQANGCMGGGYDPVNQLLYVACPGATPVPSAWQIGPL